MKKSSLKIISLGLCAALCVGGVGATAYALNSNDVAKNSEPRTTVVAEAENSEIAKDETVYVFAGADGSVNKIIVSDWIKNTLSGDEIKDQSQLENIENLKGEETYSINGDNMKVWDAEGNDIYYRGNIKKELPVNLAVSYKLDGKSISAEELAGKSGKVTIRFDYENQQYEMVNIDGKQEKIYVPFAMLTGMLLDNDTFRNVEVSGGKLINDGNRTAVVGIAFPGLQENLSIEKETLDIPEYVEITADVTEFKLGMTATIATNEVFNEIDTDNLDSFDELSDSLNKLTDAMSQLLDGSSELYNGLCTLLDKSGELVSGINQLADGAENLKGGAKDLDDGAAALKSGMAELYAGLSKISSNNKTLNGGAKQVFDTLLSTANTQIAAAGLTVPTLTVENYASVLNRLIESLDETTVYNQALQTVTAKVEESRPLIVTKVTDAVKTEVEKKVTAAVKEQVAAQVNAAIREQVAEQVIPVATNHQMTKETYEAAVKEGQIDAATQNAIETAIDAQMATDSIKAMIQTNISAQMISDSIKTTITAKTEEQMKTQEIQSTIAENVELQVKQAISENMSSDEVQKQLAAASEGAKSIISLKTSLDSYHAFYLGLLAYTDGVASATEGAAKLNSGASDLKDGTTQLKVGVGQLFDGILQLKNGAPALVEGVTKLKDGSMQLSDGLKQFNEEGIQKLVDALDGDLSGVITRMRATVDVSKNYKNFSGISDGMDGQVKFIYRTEAIEIEK